MYVYEQACISQEKIEGPVKYYESSLELIGPITF